MISQFLLIIPMPTVDKRIWTSDPSLRRRMLYPAELCRHTIFGLKSRFFSLFDHPDRWPIFSIFSRYFFRRKCYLRPLQHLAFLIKILSTEFPSTPEYFSKVLSTGPPLGVDPIRWNQVQHSARKSLEIQGFSLFQILSGITLHKRFHRDFTPSDWLEISKSFDFWWTLQVQVNVTM